MSQKRVKLTAGGNKYVSEFLRFTCPSCQSNHFIHPEKWPLHLQRCTRELPEQHIIFLFENELNQTTKQILGSLILSRSRTENN